MGGRVTQLQPTQSYNSKEFSMKLTDVQTLHTIGSGSSGRVEKGIHIPTNTTLALKVFK